MAEKINSKTPWQEVTPGGTIYSAGNAMDFKTGDWRSVKPVYLSEKCKQCGLCFPVCPDDAIPSVSYTHLDVYKSQHFIDGIFHFELNF